MKLRILEQIGQLTILTEVSQKIKIRQKEIIYKIKSKTKLTQPQRKALYLVLILSLGPNHELSNNH